MIGQIFDEIAHNILTRSNGVVVVCAEKGYNQIPPNSIGMRCGVMRCFYLNSFCLSLYKRRIFNSSQNNIKMSIYNSKLFIAQHGRMQATAFKKNNSRLFYAFTLFPYNLKLVQFWFAYQGINCNSINILFGCMQHLASLPMRQRRRDQMNSQNVIHSFFIICGVPIYIRWSSKKKLKY